MAQRSVRPFVARFLPFAALSLLLTSCWNASRLDRLFGAPPGTGGNGGFTPGIGGGLNLRDLFVGAHLLRDAPKVVKTAPADGAQDVSTKTPLVIQFSESMFEQSVRSGISLFQSGSTTSTAVTLTMFQGDAVAVLVPQVDLLPDTSYDIVVAGAVTDLQGDALDTGGGGSDQRFSFTTIQSTGDPAFDVIFSSPGQQESEVPRGTEALLVFSEPINVGSSGGGIFAPGNLVTTLNGTTLTAGVDYTVTTFPTANARGVELFFFALAPAGAQLDVSLDSDVQSADGQETINGGNGFDLNYTVQDTRIPEDVAFPLSPFVAGFDGAISSVHLHDFEADLFLTADGQLPDTATIVYFDAAQQNALIFDDTAADPTLFTSDLEPKPTPALRDGDVLVGCFVERRGFRSEVALVRTLLKDTFGPALLTMGPPGVGRSVMVTQVNDPALHGAMSEACAGVQVDFDAATPSDFNSVQFFAGQSTVTDDFFVTGASEGAPLPQQLEESDSFSFISSDVLGNTTVNLDAISHQTVGKVGAAVAVPDGATALYVSAYAGDSFQRFSSGAVLLDRFPPDPTGLEQRPRAISSGTGGSALFSDFDFSQITTPKITVTIVAERALPGGGVALFGPVTFAGLDKPSVAGGAKAIMALLPPPPSISLTNPVQCDIVNESASNPSEGGSAFDVDLERATPEFDRFTSLKPQPGSNENFVDLSLNRLQLFSVVERFNFGGTQFRFTTSEPFTSEPDSSGGFGLAKQRSADFLGRSTYSITSNPQLVHEVQFDDARVSDGGALGLRGSELLTEQFRELRVITRVPGFVDNVAVASVVAFTDLGGGLRSGMVVLPHSFLDNDQPGGLAAEDNALEMALQPDLVDPAFDPLDPLSPKGAARLKRNLRLELLIQDRRIAGTSTSNAAYSRERFIFDPTVATPPPAALTAALQPVPTVTATNLTHPPELSWSEVTQGEGMHCLSLVSSLQALTWRIYVPADATQANGGTITMRFPFLPASLPDGVGPLDFQNPGLFKVVVESYDLDPAHAFGPGSAEQYDFDPQSWFQSDLERECLRSSRSDPDVTIQTVP